MRTDDEFDPWLPEPPAAQAVPNGTRAQGGQRRVPVATGWPGARWRLERGTVLALVVFLVAAVVLAGFLLLRRPGPVSAVPDATPVVSGVPDVTAPGASPALAGFPSGPTVSSLVPGAMPGASPGAVPGASAGASGNRDGRLRVYMIGQVRHPGVVALPPGSRVEDAVDAAGGATRKADLTAVNLARPVNDGEQIYLPRPGEKPRMAVDPGTAAGSGAGLPGGAAAGPLDLNAATLAQLDELPGVGPVLAQRILEYRQQKGRYASVDELGDVQGIGDATLAKLRPLVRV